LTRRWDALVPARRAARAPQERLLAAVAVCAAGGAALEATGAAALPAAAPPAGGPAAERAAGAATAGAEAAEEAAAQAAARAQGAFAAALLRPPGAARAARRHLRALLQGARCARPGAPAGHGPPGTLRLRRVLIGPTCRANDFGSRRPRCLDVAGPDVAPVTWLDPRGRKRCIASAALDRLRLPRRDELGGGAAAEGAGGGGGGEPASAAVRGARRYADGLRSILDGSLRALREAQRREGKKRQLGAAG